MAVKISIAAQNAALNAITALLGTAGTLKIYTGTPPATVEEAPTGTLIAELTFANPAFGAAANGVATAGTIGQDASINSSQTLSASNGYFRAVHSDGVSEVLQGTVHDNGDINTNSNTFVAGQTCNVTGWTLTLPST